MTVPQESAIEILAYVGVKPLGETYDFGFLAYSESDLVVTHQDAEGLTTTLARGTNYDVFIDPDIDGGEITILSDITTPASGGWLEIRRVLPIVQSTTWNNNSPFNAIVLERDLDRLVMITQQLNTVLQFSVQNTNWAGVWTASTEYAVNALITGPESYANIYMCMLNHTSSTDFSNDLNPVSGSPKWQLVMDLQQVVTSTNEAIAAASTAVASATEATTSAAEALSSANSASLSETATETAEAAAAIHAQDAANCSAAAYDSAVEAANSASSIVSTTLVEGDGASIDNTDPRNPIVATEGLMKHGNGFVTVGVDVSNRPNVGSYSFDLQGTASASYGCTGIGSITMGDANLNQADMCPVFGSFNVATAGTRAIIGYNNYGEHGSHMLGSGLKHSSFAVECTLVGSYNAWPQYSGAAFVVGIGGGESYRKTGLCVNYLGDCEAPECTIADIDNRGAKALITKEYLDQLSVQIAALDARVTALEGV